MLLLITHKLKAPGKDYTPFFNLIKSAEGWLNHLDSTWFIKTNEDVAVWQNKLKPEMAPGDYLFVVNITKSPRSGWLPKEAWDWLRAHED